MSKIHKDNLTEVQSISNKMLSSKSNKHFELFSNTDLFVKMLKTIEFDNPEVDNDDFKKYIIDGKIYLGLDTTEDFEFDENHYLFDAFNVYYAYNSFVYYSVHKGLTKAWRKILKDTYNNTSYPEDLKKVLKKELKDIVDKFNEDNVDLL